MSSFDVELAKELEKLKKKKKEETVTPKSSRTSTFEDQLRVELESLKKTGRNTGKDTGKYSDFSVSTTDDIAPVRTHGGGGGKFGSSTDNAKKKDDDKKWYESGLFADGWDFGDLTKTILGVSEDSASLKDLTVNSIKKGYYNSRYGEESYKAMSGHSNDKETYKKLLQGEDYQFTPGNTFAEGVSGAFELIGQMGRQFTDPSNYALALGAGGAAAIAGQVGPQVLLPEEIVTVPVAATAGWASGVAGQTYKIEAGHAYNEMLEAGVTEKTAKTVANIVGAGNAALEALQVDELIDAYKVLNKSGAKKSVLKRIMSELADRGIDVAKETAQEVAQEGITIAGVQTASKIDNDEWAYNAGDVTERLWDTAKSSALSFGMMNAPATAKNITSIAVEQKKENKLPQKESTLSQDEQTILDKVVEEKIADQEKDGKQLTAKQKSVIEERVRSDLEKGYISAEKIEEIFGGEKYDAFRTAMSELSNSDDYKAYKKAVEAEETARKEFDPLVKMKQGEMTGEQIYRRDELKKILDESKVSELKSKVSPVAQNVMNLRDQMRSEVMERVKDTRLAESYRELERSKQKFTADTSKYKSEYARKTVQNIIDSGLAVNTNEWHEKVDWLAQIAESRELVFKLADNNTLKTAVEGYDPSNSTLNAFIDEKTGEVTLNMDSKEATRIVAGHEVSHTFEKAKSFKKLQDIIFNHAIQKEGLENFNKRLKDMEDLYRGKENTTPERELTAQLLGEYMFTDADFISNLATQNRNVFERIYNEIKYLYKIATAGSKEARELEQAKRMFDKVWRESLKNKENSGESTKYSLEKTNKNKYNKRSRYSETETLFMSWENSSAPVGEVKKFSRFGKTRYYEKTESGSVELSKQQFIERNNVYAENTYRRAERRFGTAADYDETTQRGLSGDYISNRDTSGDAAVFGQTIREKLPYVSRGSESSTLRDGTGNAGINQSEYNEEASAEEQDASFVTFSNDYATIRNYMKDGDVGEEADVSPVKYSLSKDTDGKQLTREQQEFFKASKVVDENGNLKVMYHGTSKGGHTVFDSWGKSNYGLFGTGSYFTDSKSIAESYTKKGKGTNPQIYETYLNITNPLDMDAPADPAKWEKAFDEVDFPESGTNEDFYRAVEEYYADQYMPKWEVAEIIRESIEFGMGYDGITHIGGGRVNPDGERHRVYIAFNPEQVKNIDNAKPTDNPDIRFSLSKSVEETKDLVALHNLTEDKLMKSLELGGLPMPSLAITKADIPHSNFGEITLVFGRDTIDPKKNKKNKVYSADAWTPVFPRVEYEADSKVANRVSQKLRDLGKKIDDSFQRDLYRVTYDFDDMLNRNGGEEGLIQRVMDNDGMKAAYLEEQGKHIDKVTKQEEAPKDYNPANADKYQKIMGILGVTTAEEIRKVNLRDAIENHGAELEAVYPGVAKTALRLGRLLGVVESYIKNKDIGTVYQTVTDTQATQKALNDALDAEGYETWVRNLFSGIVKDSGIYNNKEIFTPSGNRRSFKQTHMPVTLENIVKAMASQNDGNAKNVSGFNGVKTLRAATAETFKSVEEMHQKKGRLQNLTQEQFEAITNDLQTRLYNVMEAIDNESGQIGGSNPFIRMDSIGETLTEIGESGKYGVADIQRVFNEYSRNISDDTALEVKQLLYDVAQMPVNIFEAKPQRVVNFDEAKVFVIPNNANTKLKQELLNRGYSIAEYDPNVEGDRQKVVNQFEEYQFSLSNVGKEPYIPVNDAPLNKFKYKEGIEEFAPVAEKETVPETVAENATTEELFPDDREELTNLLSHQFELRGALEAAVSMGDTSTMSMLTQEYEDVTAKIRELEAQEAERFDSLDDADAPMDMGTQHDEVADTTPLNKKTVTDLSKKVKSLLGLKNNRTGEVVSMIEAYSRSDNPSSEKLFEELKEKFGKYTDKSVDDATREVKALLRSYRINVSDSIKSEIADYADLMRRNFGRVRFSKEGLAVDEVYSDLSAGYPGYFPESIINPTDQLLQIINVANMEAETVTEITVDDETLADAARTIARTVRAYKQNQMQALTEKESKEAFDSLMKSADEFAPADDIAPVKQKEKTAKIEKPTAPEGQIKTVKERLTAKMQNLETELENNRRLRAESWMDYDNEISRAQAEYNAKSNKNTVAANDLLRRIERLNRMKHNTDADFSKRISDLEERVAKVGEEVRTGQSSSEQGAMRQELHNRIVSNIRSEFENNGFSLETVLSNAKNLSTFATVDNTPQRVMEKALGYKAGGILADLTVNKVAQNETEGIKWLNAFTDRKNGVLAQISRQYHIKPGSKKSAAAQMYAEGFYVNGKNEIVQYGDAELAQDFPNAKVRENIKGLARDPRIRQIYDSTLAMINASRARNAYPEIQKLDNYFLHFRAMDDTFSKLGIPFNPNDIKAKDLPTDLNGVTADLKPGQPYFASAMHREGKRTSFDLLGGLERYLSSAKNQIYHIDDIQTLRALRNYVADTYGQAKGLESLDLLTEEEAQERIEQVYGAHLSTFAKFLNEEANVIAGKTALIDRGLEGVIGRRGMTFLDTVNRQVGSNMVGFNVSSSLTNFLAPVQAFAKANKFDFVKAFAQTTANKVGSIFGRTDGFAENSPVVIRRKGEDRFYRTPWQKVSDAGYTLMGAVDDFSTELIARAKYNELTRKGMDAQQAHIETDKWVSRLMGDRSLGQQPQLYNSKMLGIITKFQLEVRNQLDAQFYDTIQETKASNEDIQNGLLRNAKTAAKVTSTFVQLAVAQHLFGKVFESIAGYNPAFDIISAIIKAAGWDDDEDDEDTVLDNIEEGFLELLGDLPYTSTLTGGRIPISSALPIEQFVTGKDQYGNEKSRWDTLAEAAPYYLLPGGYGQAKKTYQGLSMFDDDLPVSGSYTNSGNLRFPVEDTLVNRAQAGFFGQYASANARDYFDNERSPLKPKQIQEYIDSDLPIADYWKYREGLSEHPTLDAKGDYIGSLDLPISTKNLFINNIAQREEPIDMTDYSQYPNFSEFDWAEQNEEKYAFLQEHGMSYADYEKLDEDSKKAYTWAYNNPERYEFVKEQGLSATEYYSLDDDTKDAYKWAYDNPEMFTVSKAISDDFLSYYQYKTDLSKLNAKDENGESVSGLKKERVIEYINNLDIDYGQKIILFRSMYDGKADQEAYNSDIVDYLNSRDDITYQEMVTILKKLGFTVKGNTVTW